MPPDADAASDIVQACEEVQSRLVGKTIEDFAADAILRDSIVLQMIVIGESARHLSENVRDQFPEVPWSDIWGMRNRLVHSYQATSLEVVWDTAQIDIPLLRQLMQRWLDDEDRRLSRDV